MAWKSVVTSSWYCGFTIGPTCTYDVPKSTPSAVIVTRYEPTGRSWNARSAVNIPCAFGVGVASATAGPSGKSPATIRSVIAFGRAPSSRPRTTPQTLAWSVERNMLRSTTSACHHASSAVESAGAP